MKILLIDDDPLGRQAIFNFLTGQLGHEVVTCEDGLEGLKAYKADYYSLVISDIKLPGINGIDLTRKIKEEEKSRFTDVVLITGFGNMDTVIQALKAGAYDYLQKPIDIDELESVVKRAEDHISLIKENAEFKDSFDDLVDRATSDIQENCKRLSKAYNRLLGVQDLEVLSDSIEEMRDVIMKLHADRRIPILIEGETGTGKEIVAKLIHFGEEQVTAPFIPINCTAIPETLFETELFGYEEGAFTDAKKKGTKGKFELADGGTIFLDEIGDLPLKIQPKLLRVLEERSIYRVGGIKKVKLDIRVICATNCNLEEKIREGSFREDLYYRLNLAQLKIAPLREQQGTIEKLARYFLQTFAKEKERRFRDIDDTAMQILTRHDWQGNIRELKNSIERIVFLFDDEMIRPEHLEFLHTGTEIPAKTLSLRTVDDLELPEIHFDIKAFEKQLVLKAIEKFNGNKTQAAKYLGLTRSALRSRL